MARPKVTIRESMAMSRLLFLIARGITSPRALARALNIKSGAVGIQLGKLRKGKYVTTSKHPSGILNKSVYKINYGTIISDLFDMVYVLYDEIVSDVEKRQKWYTGEFHKSCLNELPLAQKLLEEEISKKNLSMLESAKKYYDVQKEILKDVKLTKVDTDKLIGLLSSYLWTVSPFFITESNLNLEDCLKKFILDYGTIYQKNNTKQLRRLSREEHIKQVLKRTKGNEKINTLLRMFSRISMTKKNPYYSNSLKSSFDQIINKDNKEFMDSEKLYLNEIKTMEFNILKERLQKR